MSGGQRDFGIAVQDALRADDCMKDLWDALTERPKEVGDEVHYRSNVLLHPYDEAWVHQRNSRDLAVEMIAAAAIEKRLPIWLRLEHGEGPVDAKQFENIDRRTWRHGYYRSGRGDTHLDGRPLWVKNADWKHFLKQTLDARAGNNAKDKERKPPSATAWSKWVSAYRNDHATLPSVDRVIWPDAKAAFPDNLVTQRSVRETFGGEKPGPRP